MTPRPLSPREPSSLHESAHAVIGLRCDAQLRSITLHERQGGRTLFSRPPDSPRTLLSVAMAGYCMDQLSEPAASLADPRYATDVALVRQALEEIRGTAERRRNVRETLERWGMALDEDGEPEPEVPWDETACAWLQRTKSVTCRSLEIHHAAVMRVARALLRRGDLTGKQLHHLIHLS
jgi:hypothetical protein